LKREKCSTYPDNGSVLLVKRGWPVHHQASWRQPRRVDLPTLELLIVKLKMVHAFTHNGERPWGSSLQDCQSTARRLHSLKVAVIEFSADYAVAKRIGIDAVHRKLAI